MELFENENVLTFLMKNVEARLPKIDFRLDEEEAKEIVYRLKKNQYYNLAGALNADLLLYLESQGEKELLKRILRNARHVFNPQTLNTFIELNIAILHQISNHSDPQYKHAKKLLEEIFSLYPDSRKSFNKELTEDQKILLIKAALTNISLQEYDDFTFYLESQGAEELLNRVVSTMYPEMGQSIKNILNQPYPKKFQKKIASLKLIPRAKHD